MLETLSGAARARPAAIVGLLVALGAYTAFGGRLPDLSTDADVAFIAALVIPAAFGFVWLVLPWREARGLAAVVVGLGVLSFLCWLADLDTLSDLAKLAALTAVGFWFLTVFEALSWVVLIAAVIPWVDAFSVARGPTEYVVREQPGFFEEIAYGFRVPGEDAFAHLGPPDIVFFALFLAAAARFGLRVGWTWAAMTALLGLTLILTVWFDVAGLPALPAISLGFLAPNADLLWRRWRKHRASRYDTP